MLSPWRYNSAAPATSSSDKPLLVAPASGEAFPIEIDVSEVTGGTPGDTLIVNPDGTLGQTAAAPAFYSDAEVPAGTINGINAAFTLAHNPSPDASLMLFKNGILQTAGTDYNLSGTTITYVGGAIPQNGDAHVCWYRY